MTNATLSATGWFQNEQIIVVPGVTRASELDVTPDPISVSDWQKWGIEKVGQGANTVMFACQETPTYDVYVQIDIVG